MNWKKETIQCIFCCCSPWCSMPSAVLFHFHSVALPFGRFRRSEFIGIVMQINLWLMLFNRTIAIHPDAIRIRVDRRNEHLRSEAGAWVGRIWRRQQQQQQIATWIIFVGSNCNCGERFMPCCMCIRPIQFIDFVRQSAYLFMSHSHIIDITRKS